MLKNNWIPLQKNKMVENIELLTLECSSGHDCDGGNGGHLGQVTFGKKWMRVYGSDLVFECSLNADEGWWECGLPLHCIRLLNPHPVYLKQWVERALSLFWTLHWSSNYATCVPTPLAVPDYHAQCAPDQTTNTVSKILRTWRKIKYSIHQNALW